MAEITITAQNFESEVLKHPGTVLLDFWAEWCPPCRALAPTIAQIAKEREGSVKVGKVNVDVEQGLAMRYGIASIPTMLVFKNGTFVHQLIGLQPKQRIDALLD